MAFKKNMFNKKPRRIHRNKGGRKKGSILITREYRNIKSKLLVQ